MGALARRTPTRRSFRMSSHAKQTTATVIPCLRYRDALAMIEWLCKAFGRRETQACYVVVTDCAAHYTQARAAGAEIVHGLETRDYGGSGYSARDPEGHLWSFGDHDPRAEQVT
jgi:uncharacterized glyoxalase superfamily protein PhnB